MILNKLKKHSPKTYRALRSARDNVDFFFKKRSLIKNLNNSSINIINSLENVEYFEYKKKSLNLIKVKKKESLLILKLTIVVISTVPCVTQKALQDKKN